MTLYMMSIEHHSSVVPIRTRCA